MVEFPHKGSEVTHPSRAYAEQAADKEKYEDPQDDEDGSPDHSTRYNSSGRVVATQTYMREPDLRCE